MRRGFAKAKNGFDARALNVQQVIGNVVTENLFATNINTGTINADTLNLSQSQTGEVNFNNQTVTINSGNINGVVIGASTPAAGTFTTLTANPTLNVGTNSNNPGIITAFGSSGNFLWNGLNASLTLPGSLSVGNMSLNGLGQNLITSTINDIDITPPPGNNINLNVSDRKSVV